MIIHFLAEPTPWKKVGRLLHSAVALFEDLLTPIPIFRFFALPTDRIFLKQWWKGSYVPTLEEKATIDRYSHRRWLTNADQYLQERAEFKKRHPHWVRIRKGVTVLRQGAIALSLLFALNFAHEAQGNMTTVQQYMRDPQYALQPNQIRLINETVPFPHTAVQIGDTIYSYGVQYVTKRPKAWYLQADLIRGKVLDEAAKKDGSEIVARVAEENKGEKEEEGQDENEPVPEKGSITKATDWVTEPLAGWLSKMDRSVQMVTVNFDTVEQVIAFRRLLEAKTGYWYANWTMVNDCTVMLWRAIEEITGWKASFLIDASPGQSFMYLAGLKTTGDPRIGLILQVQVEGQESPHPYRHLARNALIQFVESKFFIHLVEFNLTYRAYMELTYSPEDLQYLRPEMKRAIQHWEKDVQARLKKDAQLFTFQILAQRILTEAQSGQDITERAKERKQTVVKEFNRRMEEARRLKDAPEAAFEDWTRAEYRIHLLETMRDQLVHLFDEAIALSSARQRP